MAIIDPQGLFGGDRLRRCSNAAQLHWPRIFLASDGFARLEINYPKIIGRAYSTFSPAPSAAEIEDYIQEYARQYLLFVYPADGQIWAQWDTKSELLPRYKTAQDRRSPIPPEPAFSEWKKRYRNEPKTTSENLRKFSELFLHGVGGGGGVGVGKNICASTSDARVSDPLPSIDDPPFGTTDLDGLFSVETAQRTKSSREMKPEQERWFSIWWSEYWLHKAKKPAREAFRKHVRTEERFQRVIAATHAQKLEMLNREPSKRPHGATWLNAERWDDETEPDQEIRRDIPSYVPERIRVNGELITNPEWLKQQQRKATSEATGPKPWKPEWKHVA